VARLHGGVSFSAVDLEMTADFAGQASVAMELAKARAAHQRMALLEDRGRIARDLHDHVIQQLFATGLELQSVAGALSPSPEAERVLQTVSSLDAAIAQIRTVIFALASQSGDRRDTIRHWVIDLANELASGLARTPSVQFSGPVDMVVTDGLAADVVAVTREALSNSAKYAQAQNTTVSLAASDGWVVLEISDDGVGGVAESPRRSGLANLRERAVQRGGTLTLDSDASGTRVRWSVPFDLAE